MKVRSVTCLDPILMFPISLSIVICPSESEDMPAKVKRRTRQKSGDLGAPSELPDVGVLPTNKEIIASVENELDKKDASGGHAKTRAYFEKDSYVIVRDALIRKYLEVNPKLPLLSDKHVEQKIARIHQQSKKAERKHLKPKEAKLFKENLLRLCDIVACRCDIINCGGGEDCRSKDDCTGFHVFCKCAPEHKIPETEVRFIKDQREKVGILGGEMLMEGKDVKGARLDKKREEKEEKRAAKEKKKAEAAAKVEENIKRKKASDKMESLEEATDDLENLDVVDDDFEYLEQRRHTERTTIRIDLFASEAVRFGVSDRAAAALWNGAIKALEDNDFLEKRGDGSIAENLTVDKFKMGRAKESVAKKQKKKKKEEVKAGIECIGTDGKRDRKTKIVTMIKVNGVEKEKWDVGTEEHVVYTNEPGGEYLTHTTAKDGTGRGLANDLIEILGEYESKDSLKAICCDGTATNTGWQDGMVAHTERDLEKKLLLLSCMLHENELPFRKVFDKLDGGHGTTGPESFGGEIGKAAKEDLHLKDVVEFEKMETNLEDIEKEVLEDLSRDQKLLYQYIKAISEGEVSQRLSIQKVGPLNHSRWLTLAIRILQLYTRTENPTEQLRKIVRFILQVYGPCWFAIKKAKKITSGPALLFHQMTLIKTQTEDVQEMAKPAVQRNAFMAEPGIMLCAMLESSSASIRSKAVETIKNLRSKPPKKPRKKILRGIRSLQVQKLDWEAFSWIDIIDWKKAGVVHEHYIIECLPMEVLEAALAQPYCFPAFPVHTQSVERAVKLVTEASHKVVKHLISNKL